MHQGGDLLDAERLDQRAVGVAEGQQPLLPRAEERGGVGFVGGDDPRGAAVGPVELLEDAARGLEQPRALVGVRVEHDRHQVEHRHLVGQGQALAAVRMEGEVGRDGCHGREGSASTLGADPAPAAPVRRRRAVVHFRRAPDRASPLRRPFPGRSRRRAGERVRDRARSVPRRPAGMVAACRRIIDRHLTCGPLWWLCATMLCSPESMADGRRAAEALQDDPTGALLASELPIDATVTRGRLAGAGGCSAAPPRRPRGAGGRLRRRVRRGRRQLGHLDVDAVALAGRNVAAAVQPRSWCSSTRSPSDRPRSWPRRAPVPRRCRPRPRCAGLGRGGCRPADARDDVRRDGRPMVPGRRSARRGRRGRATRLGGPHRRCRRRARGRCRARSHRLPGRP